jgi:hypothetical protein
MDLKKSIDDKAARINLEDLAKKGISKVKVINKQTILKLVQEAVERIISTKTDLLSDQERQEIMNRSKEELSRLIKEQKQGKDKVALAEQDKNELVKEVINLNEQNRLMQKMHSDEMAHRYEDGVKSQQSLVDELKNEIETLKNLEETKESNLEGRLQQRYDEGVTSQQTMIDNTRYELEEQKNTITSLKQDHADELKDRFEEGVNSQKTLVDELKNEIDHVKGREAAGKEGAADELKQRFEEGVSSQQALIDGLRGEIDEFKSSQSSSKAEFDSQLERRFEEGATSQQPLVDELRSEIGHLKEQGDAEKAELQKESDFVRQRLEELSESDETVANNMESLFEKMSESIGDKISNIKVAGGGGGGGGGGNYADMPTVSLENIFKEELESNLDTFRIKKETSKTSLKGSLSRLKNMRGDDDDDDDEDAGK